MYVYVSATYEVTGISHMTVSAVHIQKMLIPTLMMMPFHDYIGCIGI